MGISEYIKKEYEENLLNRYNELKKTLESDNFVPGPEEVWKMYEEAFHENQGAYKFVIQLLGVEMFDKNGRLNEYHIYLDDINKRISDYCSAYVIAIKKK